MPSDCVSIRSDLNMQRSSERSDGDSGEMGYGRERQTESEIEPHLLRLSSPLLDPHLGLVPGLVQRKEARLSAALDELVGFGDELGGEDPPGQLGVRSNGI